MTVHSVARSRSLVEVSISEPLSQATRWSSPVVANATGVPNTTSIRGGWREAG